MSSQRPRARTRRSRLRTSMARSSCSPGRSARSRAATAHRATPACTTCAQNTTSATPNFARSSRSCASRCVRRTCRSPRATNCSNFSPRKIGTWPGSRSGAPHESGTHRDVVARSAHPRSGAVMRIQRLQTRIIVFFVALLALVQVAAFWFVNAANSSNAHAKIEEELNVGQRVFARLLDQNAEKLKLSARVLAADYAFREAIATHDSGTIASVLSNHGARIGADAMVFVALDGNVV